MLLLAAALACTVVDRDTIRCDGQRIRLLGIDAPELHACRKGRICVPGDPIASRESLIVAMGAGPVRVDPVTKDRYGRIVALVYAGSVNLSCWQIERGRAAYVAKWDNGRLVAKACRIPS